MTSSTQESSATAAGDADALRAILDIQRDAFGRDGPPSVTVRRNRIDRLLALVLDNIDEFTDAMTADFGTRSRAGSVITEVVGMIPVVEHTRAHVATWMRATRIARVAGIFGFRAEVQHAPLGVVGVIGPWNFPLNLVVLPTAAAFAAGNRVMIKMSEITPHTAAVLESRVPQYFDPAELAVVTGGVEVAARFAALPFDHLFFTGSSPVGTLVQRAAAANLVPVTLELGGKNPIVIAPDGDIRRSAHRIANAKLVNGGQVCLCPDYVFVPQDRVDSFVAALRTAFRDSAPTIVGNDDYCSSVDTANFDRVLSLVDDARSKGANVEVIAPQGETHPDRAGRKIAPTIVRDSDDGMRIAAEEIFGPVLVVKSYTSVAETIEYVNARPAPLVAYWFGSDGADFRDFVRRTRSGGVARNDFAANLIPSSAPFGGVGHSGMGAYHGKAGFDTFSHQRTVVGNDLPFSLTGLAGPPFGRAKRVYGAVSLRVSRRRTNRRLGRPSSR